MRLIFMGTPEFSCVALRALRKAGHEIVCVYAQPPRPKGRGLELQKQPVHLLADELKIEVRTPVSLKSAEEQQRFVALKADAAVVVAYGLMLPKPILEGTMFGCFNIHASLLPRWRGAAPIQRAIMAGDKQTGVAIMRMEEGLDTGPVIRMQAVPIHPATTAGSLHTQLAELGARLIVEALHIPSVHGTVQSNDGVTYAKKIDKAEAHVNFNLPAEEVRNYVHGLSPFPGAWCMIAGARLKVLNVEVTADQGVAGTALDNELTFACAAGAIRILNVQREGKGPMDAATFLRGFSVPKGTGAS